MGVTRDAAGRDGVFAHPDRDGPLRPWGQCRFAVLPAPRMGASPLRLDI